MKLVIYRSRKDRETDTRYHEAERASAPEVVNVDGGLYIRTTTNEALTESYYVPATYACL